MINPSTIPSDLNNNNRVSLPPALQQQLDRLQGQADQATTQAQATDPQTRDAQARDVGQKSATGGAVGTGAAALAMILGAIAAAFGGRTGERVRPIGVSSAVDVNDDDDRVPATPGRIQ